MRHLWRWYFTSYKCTAFQPARLHTKPEGSFRKRLEMFIVSKKINWTLLGLMAFPCVLKTSYVLLKILSSVVQLHCGFKLRSSPPTQGIKFHIFSSSLGSWERWGSLPCPVSKGAGTFPGEIFAISCYLRCVTGSKSFWGSPSLWHTLACPSGLFT